MKNKSYIFFVLMLAVAVGAAFVVTKKVQAPQRDLQLATSSLQQESQMQQTDQTQQVQKMKSQTVDPIENAKARITKKPFGIFITKQNSPVQPERFSGYHTAVDLETTPAEQNIDVKVLALCDGKLLAAKNASGYGGVAVQSCVLDGQAVTIVYGHVRLSSVAARIGTELKAGDFLANLGTGFSAETDGERKHLHLGIHKGTSINILGYVQSKSELSGWLDGAKYLN